MNLQVHQCGVVEADPTLSLVCPQCRRQGTLDTLHNNEGADPTGHRFGFRRCPNPECHLLIFVIHQNRVIVAAYPPARLEFDTTNIPAAVSRAMEEAIACHSAECYIASAIMVRKTLEELCLDRQATGGSLKERLKALHAKVVLPQELLEGIDDLRLLGNDAAHVESQEFNKVGKDEVEVGVEFAREVLKAVYQYSELLKRLRALKKTP